MLCESDDDLDTIPRHRSHGTDHDANPNRNTASSAMNTRNPIEISSDDAQGVSSHGKRRARGERVAFTDDEDSDAAYKQFKARKTVERKKLAAERAKTKKTNKTSMVGKKPKSLLTRPKQKEKHYGDPSDDDEALMDSTLPDYLQDRLSAWDRKRQKLGDAGLQFPPDYDEVYFSDDERLESLRERPGVSEHMQPRAEYKDIELPASHGIIPAPIAQFLRKYQVEGVEFLHELFVYQRGGILGDDMGLGKTIQVIAFLTVVFGKTGDERDAKRMRKMRRRHDDKWYPRVLLVVPGTLVANWKNELEKWGWWHIYTCHGSDAGRKPALEAAATGRLEIMITTYDTYRNHASAIDVVRWDCVIADECHKIKERTSETTKTLNNVNALCRIGLTGTAIQNKYEELWTLLNWTNPGAFGTLSTWKKTIAIPLKLGQSHDATYAQLKKSREIAKKLVNNLLPRFLLRRPKTLIADQLPKKSDKVVFCPLSPAQELAYNNFCDVEIVHCIRRAYDPCDCRSGKKGGWCCYTRVDDVQWQHFVFPALQTFQKIANHLALLLPHSPGGGEKHGRELRNLQMSMPDSWKAMYAQRDSILHYTDPQFCGKWGILKKLLKLWYANGDKVLVFSYSVRLLEMLDMLFKMTTTYNVSTLSGKTPNDERQVCPLRRCQYTWPGWQTNLQSQIVVDDFNSNPNAFVFLISTKAGGLGLNITSANKVVIVDPNWNPAYDLQAQDRAYRLGQTRDVEVFRLISAGTIEEIVYARQIYKQQQANIGYNASLERRYFKGVQDQKELKGEIFGLANLFAPTSEEVKLRDIFNKTNIAESRAGVEIAGLDLEASRNEDDDDVYDGNEDTALSKLAQEIIDEPATRRKKAEEGTKQPDGVMAILASAGVKYTHENAEVIGTSKVETRISSRAQKASGDVDWNRERAFVQSQASQNDASNAATHPHARKPSSDEDNSAGEEGRIRYKYKPPEDVRKRQFCSIAKSLGFENVSDFALVVEGWTQEQRRTALDRFYASRRAALAK